MFIFKRYFVVKTQFTKLPWDFLKQQRHFFPLKRKVKEETGQDPLSQENNVMVLTTATIHTFILLLRPLMT